MSDPACKHPDIRKFDGLRCCLACGETVFEASASVSSAKNVDNTGHYRYTKLNYKLGLEIRLVVLLPGHPADPICCEIIHVNLDDHPGYDAVSYTWATESGDASLSRTVRCVNGGVMAVTANCEAALRQLRRLWYRVRLWIDAICIDQDNVEEKNHQVGLMDRIYFCASSVRICIQDLLASKGYDDYGALFRGFEILHSDSDRGRDKSCGPSSARTRNSFRAQSYGAISWEACMLIHLYSLRYFQRIWVIQEVAFAKAVYLMVNGQELFLTSSVLEQLTTAHGHLPSSLSWRLNQQGKADIICCLHAGAGCKMTDPRDRIFAVLSLMESRFRSLIPVDYSMSNGSVHARAITTIMSTRQTLDILSYAGVGNPITADWQTGACLDGYRLDCYLKSKQEPPLLPIWALSPQFEGDTEGLWRSSVEIKTASSGDYQKASSHDNISCLVELPQPAHPDFLPRLRVQAHYLDRICQPDIEGNIGGQTCSRDLDMDHMWRDTHWLEHSYYTWMKPLFGDDCSNTPWDPHIPHSTCHQEERPKAATPPGGEALQAKLEDLIIFLKKARRYQRCDFFSSHFSIGISRGGIQKGDEIFAVDGVRIPLVLRRVSSQRYRIVSGCLLWAALQLDCWNPGTKQGRCGPGIERPTNKQTQMIEIY